MALEVITKDAIQVILVDDFNGILLDHHVLLYLFEYGKKLGEVWNGSGTVSYTHLTLPTIYSV